MLRRARRKEKIKGYPSKDKEDMKGDLLVRDIWTQVTDSIHDMRVVNMHASSYQYQTSDKYLETDDGEKKRKYPDAWIKQRWYLTPLVDSVDGILGVKAIARRLTTKWKELYSRTYGYRKSGAATTLVRATHCCIQEVRVTVSKISVKQPQ